MKRLHLANPAGLGLGLGFGSAVASPPARRRRSSASARDGPSPPLPHDTDHRSARSPLSGSGDPTNTRGTPEPGSPGIPAGSGGEPPRRVHAAPCCCAQGGRLLVFGTRVHAVPDKELHSAPIGGLLRHAPDRPRPLWRKQLIQSVNKGAQGNSNTDLCEQC